MKKKIVALVTILWTFSAIQAQAPVKPSTSEIFESVQKLNFLGSVLYLAAHPDDENTRLISYMSNQVKARTAYLSLTRGDGGQNLIGPELRELLGVIRTQELLAARRVDGGEQRFTRANDFGYSKHPEETLEIWDKEAVLGDVVWAIRQFQPDIIINRFNHRTPGTTHGHHTSSAMLSMEAFDLVNDKSAYPQQLEHVNTWKPKRLFFNTGWWFYGSRENFNKADKSNMLSVDIGVYYPLKGMSNNEVAALASSQHLCQGFGRLSQRGSQSEYLEFLKGDFPEDKDNLFAGIDTSWNRLKGGDKIGEILNQVEANFNFRNPEVHLTDLVTALDLINKLDDEHWKTIKRAEISKIIEACAGLYLEATANIPTASPNQDIEISIEALNRSSAQIELISFTNSLNTERTEVNLVLDENNKETLISNATIPLNTKYTAPYWLNKKGSLGMYKVNNPLIIGNPETDRAATIQLNLSINGMPFAINKDVVYRYSKPDKGELYRPFEVLPEATAKIEEKVIIFENDQEKSIVVQVKAGRNDLKGSVKLAYPNGWNVYPEQQDVNIKNQGDTQAITFKVIPPKSQSEGLITPIVEIGKNSYTRSLTEINYEHIPYQSVLLPSESKIVRLNIAKKGENIGYIVGAGDAVPESLKQIGYNVVIINPDDITSELLERFDAIVVGIRAYNTVDELKFKQELLFDFVEKGGNMIVQYNTSHRLKTNQIAPYKLKLSRDRVTEEDAKVTLINKEHPLLNYPNKITESDFEGWTQERGLYFPNEWGDEFTPLISMNDKGEEKKEGSLLVAQHGKGHYIYTGLSFFREFPAGVAGAYRLFANMLSIGKDNINLQEQLND
ncbi:MAG: LmbE family protein [Bacteroidetes bacterium MedPE-SWsnd-G2]|nr:MAG: LmbE family protein [Bacteroidetes bacterium MedPE-SWsnd-G2]